MSGTGQEDTSSGNQQSSDSQSLEDTRSPLDGLIDETTGDRSRTSEPSPSELPQQDEPPQQPAQQAGVPHEHGLRRAQNGDLLNSDNQVVARAGTESRHWQRANDAAREISSMRGELEQLRIANEAFRSASSTFSTLGLEPREMAAAANLMANWKQSPINVIKYLLTEAQAAGHDVNAVIGGTQAGVDPATIRRMVQDAVAPLTDAQQEQQRISQAHSNAAREYNDFAQQFPEALTQEAEIASLMRRFPEMSATEAHLRLQNYALQNGFDYSQPLQPQIELRRSGVQAPNGSTPQPANRSVLPGSRGLHANGGMTDVRVQPVAATTSTRDIVAEALRESGIVLDQ